MAKNSVIKKDFGSIFDDNMLDDEENSQTLKLSELEPNKDQPRKVFDMDALNILADSIRENGLIQPILVRPLKGGNYQIVAGERRWRACKIAGLTEVPVLIRELSDLETKQIALIENLQRENLNPIEESLGYKDLMDSFSMTQEEVARVVGKARSSITNSLRLLSMPGEIQALVSENKLSVGHCKVLMGVSKEKMLELAYRAVETQMSVRTLEKLAKSAVANKVEKPAPKKDVFYVEAEMSLKDVLGTSVRVNSGKKKSTLEIDFYSKEELAEIINKLGK